MMQRVLASKYQDWLSEEEQSRLANVVNLVLTRKNYKLVFHYLINNFNAPVCKIIASYDTTLTNRCNYCVKENSNPKIAVFCVSASVMSLNNFIIEWKITNESIGIIHQIIYDQPQGYTNDIKFLPS